MTLSPERSEQPKPREVIFDRYGVYLVADQDAYLLGREDPNLDDFRNVVMVSQPDWETTYRVLKAGEYGRTPVLTPELITVAGQPLANLHEHQAEVEEALSKVSQISRDKPDATFVIGAPYFVEGNKYPFNSAIAFKNGEIIQVAHKKLLGGEELTSFSLNPTEPPIAIGDSTLAVCRDLVGARLTQNTDSSNWIVRYVQKSTRDNNLAARFTNAKFLVPGTKRILVESCWGVGAPEGTISQLGVPNPSPKDINNYYLFMLQITGRDLLRRDPNINQVVVCDRAPLLRKGSMVASKPMSAVFFRK